MSEPDNRLVLIDGHALIYRAFYAFPSLTTKDGVMVNAVYGFTRILLSVIKDINPKYLAVTFDTPKPTFRHTDFAGYKAQRKEMPSELRGQIDLVKEIVKVLNVPIFAVDGYEADDVIGTLARQVTAGCSDKNHQGTHVLIVTGDKDSFQLVTECVHILMPAHGKNGEQEFDAQAVINKMGVSPKQIVDFKALAGDPSDNIPGVKGIGSKTAVNLLHEFGSLNALYEAVKEQSENVLHSKVLKGSTLKKIAEGYDMAMMSQKLATIDTDVPIKITLDDCRVSGYDKAKAVETFQKFGFNSLINQLPADELESSVVDALF